MDSKHNYPFTPVLSSFREPGKLVGHYLGAKNIVIGESNSVDPKDLREMTVEETIKFIWRLRI